MTNKLVPTSCVLPFLAIVFLYALDTDYFATAKSVTVFKEYRSVFNSNGKEPPKRWHAEMEGNRVVDDEGIAKTEIKTELNGLRRTETETKKNGVVLEKSMHIEGNNVDGNGKNNSTRHISLDEPKQSPSVMLVNLPVQNGNFMQPQVEKVKIVNEVIPGAERISIKQATNDEKVNEPEKDNEKDSGNSEPIRNRSEGDGIEIENLARKKQTCPGNGGKCIDSINDLTVQMVDSNTGTPIGVEKPIRNIAQERIHSTDYTRNF